MNITVILHTTQGDVRTVYSPAWIKDALNCIEQYTLDGKNFSVEQSAY